MPGQTICWLGVVVSCRRHAAGRGRPGSGLLSEVALPNVAGTLGHYDFPPTWSGGHAMHLSCPRNAAGRCMRRGGATEAPKSQAYQALSGACARRWCRGYRRLSTQRLRFILPGSVIAMRRLQSLAAFSCRAVFGGLRACTVPALADSGSTGTVLLGTMSRL